MSKNKKESNSLIWLLVIALLTVSIIAVVLIGMSKKDKQPAQNLIPTQPEKETVISYVEVEHKVTGEMIEEGLKAMGTLVTYEYYFTRVQTDTNPKKIWKVFDSTSRFTYSYDGEVTAGVNVGLVKVEKDEENKTITISLPAAQIDKVYINKDSFKLYEEKEGFKNPITLNNYNESLKEFESAVKEEALAKGVLTKADENAKRIIFNFVASLIDASEYHVDVISQ